MVEKGRNLAEKANKMSEELNKKNTNKPMDSFLYFLNITKRPVI